MTAAFCVFGNSYRVGVTQSSALRHAAPQRLNELRILKEQQPKRVPFPLFCEPHGLLPWGRLTNNVDASWRVHDELVDNWTVVLLRTGTSQHEVYDCNMSRLLAGIISGRVQSALLPKGFPGRKGVGWWVARTDGERTYAAPPAG